jgi:hypothetical protein
MFTSKIENSLAVFKYLFKNSNGTSYKMIKKCATNCAPKLRHCPWFTLHNKTYRCVVSHFSNVLRDAVMVCSFDTIGSFSGFSRYPHYYYCQRGQVFSCQSWTKKIVIIVAFMYWPIQICVKLMFEIRQSVYDLMLIFQVFLRLECRKVIIQTGTDWQ